MGTRKHESMYLNTGNCRNWLKIEDSGLHQALPTSSSRRKRKEEVTLILSKRSRFK